MRLHVTGATGYLGRELVALAPDASTERVDVRDARATEAVFSRLRPEVVIHTAYRQGGEDANATTATGAGNVARACAAVGARLVHLSTDVVFDGRAGRPHREDDPICPVSLYGRAKADAEALVLVSCTEALVVRTSLIVGGPGHTPSKHELVALDPDATFYEDELRCPVQVTDLASALLELAALDTSGVLHLGGPDAVSRADLAELVVGHPVRRAPAPSGRPLDCRLDSGRDGPAPRIPPRRAYGVRVNRLAHAISPYLLQHATNPVDWPLWGEEAFTEARRRDRPLLVSVGYSACHWCHVMEHESFADPATAALTGGRRDARAGLAGHGGPLQRDRR